MKKLLNGIEWFVNGLGYRKNKKYFDILKKKMKIKKNVIKNENGFSLIELMVVVVILSFIILGLVTFFSGGARSWISGQSQLRAQREARIVMDSMVKEIREGKKVVDVIDGSTDRITISYPTDPAFSGKGNVNFKLINGQILRNNVNILIDNIPAGGLTFNYFDNEENQITDWEKYSTASKLKIILKVDVDKDTKPDIVIETEVNLRNYGLTG